MYLRVLYVVVAIFLNSRENSHTLLNKHDDESVQSSTAASVLPETKNKNLDQNEKKN